MTSVFALLLGLGFVYVGIKYVALAWRMRSYRSTPGEVVAREVVILPTGDTTTGRWGEGGGYTPQVTYRYAIDGRELESKRLGFALPGYKQEVAARKVAEIPEKVTVWYDPKEPETAYLRRHSAALGFVLLAMGLALASGGLVGLLL